MNLLRSRAAAARMLAEGGLVLMPTDTLPGLHCRADRPDAVGRLRRMKGRPEGKLFLLLCSSLRQVRTLAELSSRRVLAYCQTCWPGPFTLILPAAAAGPVGLASSSRAVALRIPDAAALRRLIAEARGALVSTSANRAGHEPSTGMDEAAREFGPLVDGVLLSWGKAVPPLPAPRASALLDVTGWPPRLLRPGPVPPPSWWPEG